jgi:hypothetical protein
MTRYLQGMATVALLVLLGLACMGTAKGFNPDDLIAVQKNEAGITGAYQKALDAAEPYPVSQMKDSTERANIIEKLLRFNDPEKIGYLYELTQTGQIWAFYTIKGKVSSTDSQLTTQQMVDTRDGNPFVMGAPGDDGSYGPNEPGIFFFTTEGVMIEWNGLYQYTDAPLKLTTQPIAIYDATSKPSSVAATPAP